MICVQILRGNGTDIGRVAETEEGEEENEDENDEVEPEEIPVKSKREPKTKTKSTAVVAEAPDKEAPNTTKAGKRKRVNDEEDKTVATTKKAKGKEKVVETAAEEETVAKDETGDIGVGKKVATKGKEAEAQAEGADDAGERSKAGAKGKEIATEEDESDIPVKYPTPAVLNLLIGTIFSALAKPDTTIEEVLPDCPVETKEEVTKLLNTIRAFTDQEQLSKLLKNPTSEADKLLAWISTSYGTRIVEAEGDLKVPGFKSTPQFAIVKSHVPTLQKAWMNAYDEDGKESVLLFHGTALVHLRSILAEGFYPSTDRSRGVGVFMAAEPSTSAAYASGPSKGYTTNSVGTMIMAKPLLYGGSWKHDPYNTRRLLLGCEATGKGRPQVLGVGEFHVIEKLESVLPRYIFLLPPAATIAKSMPTRAKVGPAMMEAFEKIRAGIEEEE